MSAIKIISVAFKARTVTPAVGKQSSDTAVNPPFLIRSLLADNSLVSVVVEEAV